MADPQPAITIMPDQFVKIPALDIFLCTQDKFMLVNRDGAFFLMLRRSLSKRFKGNTATIRLIH
jgi:hypothetical protein